MEAAVQQGAPALVFPKLGTYIASQGGVFIGFCRDANDGEDVAVFAGPQAPTKDTFHAQRNWATSLEIEGHNDFDTGSRAELKLAWTNAPELFEERSYWTKEQHAAASDAAWGQNFDYGDQGNWDTGNQLRARAFRRLPISQFIHSLAQP